MVSPNIKSKKASGFTLAELLIVIVIIAILAAITVVVYSGITNRARAAQYANDAQSLADKFEAFNALKGIYPTTLTGVTTYDSASITSQGGIAVIVEGLAMNFPTSPPEVRLSSSLGIFGVLAPDSAAPTYDQTKNGIGLSASQVNSTAGAGAGNYYFTEPCSQGGSKIFYPIPTNSSVGTITLGKCS